MSKMDALRAMREARYAEAQKRSAGTPAKRTARPPVAPPAASGGATPAERKAAPAPAAETAAGLCGHRNMSGRTCTRESGHPQKSHRYS